MKVNILNGERRSRILLSVVLSVRGVVWCGGYGDVGLEVLVPLRVCSRLWWVGSDRGPCSPWVIGPRSCSWCLILWKHGRCERRVFEGFLPKGLEYGSRDPSDGRAVGVLAVASLPTVVGSVPALSDPCEGGDVMEVEVIWEACWYPYSTTPF